MTPSPVAARSFVPLALTVSTAFLMETLDSTILIAALPAIAQDFGIAPLRVNLAVSIYLVTMAAMIPASGWLADRIGAKRVFLMAIALFMVASLGAAAAQSLGHLVAMRVVQATAGAMMTPIGRLLLIRNTPKAQLAYATIWMSTPMQIGPVLGPLLGGWIVTYAHWSWIFLVNIPIGLIGLAFAVRVLPADTPEPVRPFDSRGFVLCLVVLSALQLVIDQFVHPMLPAPVVMVLAALIPLCALAYLWHMRRFSAPALDLTLLRLRLFRLGLGIGAMSRIGINAIPFLLQLQLQIGFGWSAARAGTIVFAVAGGAVLLKPFMRLILGRFGVRAALSGSALATAACAAALSQISPDSPIWMILLMVLAFGMVRSLQFTLLNPLTFAEVPRARQSASTSLAGVSQQLSMALGISLAAVLVAQLEAFGLTPPRSAISIAMLVMAGLTACAALGFGRALTSEDGDMINDRPARKAPTS